MVESCPKDSPGQQSLLEAAKALVGTLAWSTHWAKANLIDAIAREEVKQASLQDDAGRYAYWKSKATRYESERDTCYSDHQKEAARAQQAESSAAWWKSEGERLSAELAKMRSATDRPSSFHTYLSEIRAELQSDDSHATVAAAKAMRERAEKAEAECSEQRARAESGEDRNRDLSEKLIAAHGKTHAESERAKKTESELAKERATSSQFLAEIGAAAGRKFNEPITQTIENLRQRAELAESMLAKPQQSHPMDGGDITVMLNRAGVKAHEEGVPLSNRDRILWLLSEWGRLKMGGQPRFDGDPKACAFPSGAFSNAGPSHDLNPFADVDQLAKDASDLLSSDMGRVLARMVIEAAKKEAK